MHNYNGVEIAIVGMAGQFPSASNTQEFWQLLKDGVEAVTEFSDAELLERGVAASALADPAYVKAGVVFAGMDQFDAAFFGYTPKDAENLDPQQRLFLETAWQALEDAGIDSRRESRPIGVYAGAGSNLYMQQHLQTGLAQQADVGTVLSLINSNEKDALATRVAYKLDLRGPALTVQTACSTSLVAVHQACRGLLNFEADVALAGGVWLNLLQDLGYRHQAGAILSPDGHCRAFDAEAAGTVIGSGVGIVVLKRLDDALADGDHIYALIKGSAINNDGANKVSYSAPSVSGQAEVILAAQSMAEVSAEQITYIEAHGTGTQLGDPIEIAALTQAFQASTAKAQFCAIGSVKTNIGHLDAAAGVAGLIKTTLALKNRYLPASLNFNAANPAMAQSPFYVNHSGKPWNLVNSEPLRAGVSAFGMGGTNAHVVLEEAPPAVSSVSQRGWHVVPVSAKTPTALATLQSNLQQHLERHEEQNIADVAFTLQTGRQQLSQRSICVLENGARSQWVSGVAGDVAPNVVMMFPGQGSQHVDMGLALYQGEAVFRQTVDQCCETLLPLLGLDLKQILYPTLYPSALSRDAAEQQLAQTALTQPALFVVEYAMAMLWQSWGVRAAAMLGHSIGEYVAACLAGVFSLDDALTIVVARAKLMQSLPAGAMLAVGLTEADLAPYLGDADDACSLAAVNADGLCVVSGTLPAIARVEAALSAAEVSVVRRLQVSHAFHSTMVEPILPQLTALLQSMRLNPPTRTVISNVTGRVLSAEQATDPAYWALHLRSTVRFAAGVDTALATPGALLLEVGPSDTLSKLVRRRLQRLPVTTQLHPNQIAASAFSPLALAAGALWLAGVDLNWNAMYAGEPRRKLPLPTYPFERRSHWVAAQPVENSAVPESSAPRSIDDWFYTPSWQRIELPRQSVQAAQPAAGTTLIFADETGLADALIDALLAASPERKVIVVRAADVYTASEDGAYTIRHGEVDDYRCLIADVTEQNGAIAQIFHLFNVTAEQPDFADAQQLGFFSLLYLTQALEAQREALTLTVVANGLAEIGAAESVCAAKATLLGACKVIPQEYPAIHCHELDVVVGDAAHCRRAAQQILNEAAAKIAETLVALRGAWRWRQTFESVLRVEPERSSLRAGGVYLITGGLGGIGLALAEHMARSVQAKLVLLARTALPERATWAAVEFDAGTRKKIEHVLQLERLGAEVLLLAVDICDFDAMQAAVAQARTHFGALDGVIHAAGVAGGGMMANKTAADVEQIWAAKTRGTDSLLRSVQSDQPDFILLCSSLSSISGGLGKADYAAANAYLDASASADNVIAVNWDGWRDVGMAANLALPDGIGICPDQGCAVFERLIAARPYVQTVVSTLDINERADFSQLDLIPEVRHQHRHARPVLQTDYVAPSDDLESGLADVWSAALGLAPIGVNDHLFELGGDSLLAIQVLSKVRAIWEVEIHPADFFKDLTIAGLAQLIEIKLIEELESV